MKKMKKKNHERVWPKDQILRKYFQSCLSENIGNQQIYGNLYTCFKVENLVLMSFPNLTL